MLPPEQTDLNKIRILLADDHHRLREQLAARLNREADFEVAGVASSSRGTFQETQARQPHLLLIDPFMRDGLGLATLRQVRTAFPQVVIVILTAYVDTQLKIQFEQMGIRYILTKGVLTSQLLMTLRAAYTSRDSASQL